MKKVFSILGLIVISMYYSNFSFALNSVVVSAVVGNLNHTPVIISINPNSQRKIIGTNTIQNFTIYFRDDEKDTVYYTITPKDGSSNPTTGKINYSDYDSASGAYINLTYLSPSTQVGNSSINIIINDGPNIVSKDINLFIY